MKLINLFRFNADGAGGGSAAILADIGDKLVAVTASQKSLHETVTNTLMPVPEQIKAMQKDQQALTERMDAETKAIKAALAETHGGKSGAEDFLHMMGKFMIGLAQQKRHGRVNPDFKFRGEQAVADVIQKAATTFDTTTNASAAYLLPEILRPGVIELGDLYGNLSPLLTRFTVPAGQSLRITRQISNPVASWRTTQGGAMTESGGGSAPNDVPMAFGSTTMVTELLYVYFTIANELLNNNGIGFAALATAEALKAMNRKLEYDVLAGTDSGGAPSDGVIATATDQGTIASATFANVVEFLELALADNSLAFDTTRNTLFMHPKNALTLAAQAVGNSELTGMLVWGDPRRGVPTTLLGYPVVTHPGCYNGTSYHMLLGDPRKIFVGEDASYGIDFSEHVKFGDFETALRIVNHHDWVIPQASEWHKIVVTA